MSQITCRKCNIGIHPDRVEFLIEEGKPLRCVNCSEETKKQGFMDYAHKTAPSLVMIPQNNPEALRIAQRAFRRAR